MPDSHKEEVARFVNYFRLQLDQIAALHKSGDSTQLYQKILYVTVLDSLSKAVYPKRGNRDRMVSFIRGFSNWKDCEKISLTHLVQLLKLVPEPAFEKLREYALSTFKHWPVHAREVATLNIDPDFNEVRSRWPTEKEHRVPIENVSVESLQHIQLFYTYRNSLIHELRSPGYGIEMFRDDVPHYHLMSEVRGIDELVPKSVELVYPVGFFHKLCEDCLKRFSEYMEHNDLNPYDYYTFGSYWIRELNV